MKSQEVSADAETYDHALEWLRAQVPEGWQMLGISRWPLTTPTTDSDNTLE